MKLNKRSRRGNCFYAVILTCNEAHSPGGNVEMYLNLMERLHTAVEFFTQSNPGSVELGSVVSSAILCVLSSNSLLLLDYSI